MNVTIRRILTANSVSRRLYFAARQKYRIHQTAKVAGRCFLNADDFKKALWLTRRERRGRSPYGRRPHDHDQAELRRRDDPR